MNKTSERLVTASQLIRLEKRIQAPHVVILGAGASLAAFPKGDANGKRLPLMANIAEILGLESELADAGCDPHDDFESTYSRLHVADLHSPLLRHIENAVQDYFGSLVLPSHPTLYDLLLLSLRQKDAIFTFNWDPFLVDTYARNVNRGFELPQIFHLHGNVRVSFCERCGVAMRRNPMCPACRDALTESPLLYPIERKNYAQNQFISSQWDQLRDFLKDAFIITIFGYRAPRTDLEAMATMKDAWKGEGHDRLVERVEIIDIRSPGELSQQWHDFSFHGHYNTHQNFFQSRLARYPRRSCESLYWNGAIGKWAEEIPWVGSKPDSTATLEDLRASIAKLQLHEEEPG